MEKLLFKFRRFVDFLICMYIFPYAKNCRYLFKTKGLNTIAERFFLYTASREIVVEGDILEIGSFTGSSGLLLAAGNRLSKKKGEVWLVEPYPKPDKERFLNNFKTANLEDNIHLIDKTSQEAKEELNKKFRFIFIDGNHSYEYVKKDISLWQNSLNQGGIIAFHDYKKTGVSEAIEEMIEKSDKFTVLGTINGILYASKGSGNNNDWLEPLKRLNIIREKSIGIAKRLKLKNNF